MKRLKTISDGISSFTFAHNTDSLPVSVTRSDGKITERTYDNAGSLTRLTYPDGYFLTYTYDALNRLTQILESGTTLLASYTYDSLSRRSSITLGNSVVTEFEYEPDNDVAGIIHQFTGQPVTFDYTANKNGNRTSFSSTDDRFLYQPPADKTQEYTTNSLNQYTAINSTNLTHDLNGNLTGTGTSTYAYDPENNLKQVTTPTVSALYTTDPLGRRATKTVNTQTTEFIYDGDDVIMEFDNGTLARRFIHGPGIDEPVCMITASGRYYYHTDALGSTAALSDSTGALKESYAYSPYGEITSAGTLGNSYLFTGRQLDRESGLYYYRVRHYDPGSGRFMQPDPIGFDGGINLYAYCLNNPVNYIDPTGNYGGVDDLIFTGGGAIVGLAGQGIVDLFTGKLSSWQGYVAAGVGGAVAGEALLYTGPVGAGALGGATTNSVKQLLNISTSRQEGFDLESLAFDTLIGSATGLIPGLKIPGITQGKNSYNAIFKQMVTKFENATISNVSIKTALKMFIGRAADTSFLPGAMVASGAGLGYSSITGGNIFSTGK